MGDVCECTIVTLFSVDNAPPVHGPTQPASKQASPSTTTTATPGDDDMDEKKGENRQSNPKHPSLPCHRRSTASFILSHFPFVFTSFHFLYVVLRCVTLRRNELDLPSRNELIHPLHSSTHNPSIGLFRRQPPPPPPL